MITVVEYGVGNVGAILNMLDHLGLDVVSSGDPAKIESAERLILPGVGAYDVAMRALRTRGLLGPLESAVIGKRVPVLGICLGMQLLARGSEEGIESGLGWIAADVVRIPVSDPGATKVPHVGWTNVRVTRSNRLLERVASAQRFYFAHSYLMRCDESVDVTATFDYGDQSQLCCAVETGNVMGVQFHPEKSHRFGMQVLRRFAS
jgi:glutamine amidotransferase